MRVKRPFAFCSNVKGRLKEGMMYNKRQAKVVDAWATYECFVFLFSGENVREGGCEEATVKNE